MSEAAVKRALELVGKGYIYGAQGQICSPAFRRQQADQYPEQADNILGLGAKWDGMEVWECAQLTQEAAAAGGVELPSGATSQWTKTNWDERGTIDTLPSDEVLFLYRQSKSNTKVMSHTGIYLGDGTVVDARGTEKGVLHKTISDYPWTHWARPVWPDIESTEGDDNMQYHAKVVGPNGETVNLRSEARSGSRVKSRVRVGNEISAGEENNGWRPVMYQGISGYMMAEFVEILPDKLPESEEDVVTITLPRKVVQALIEAFNKGVEG